MNNQTLSFLAKSPDPSTNSATIYYVHYDAIITHYHSLFVYSYIHHIIPQPKHVPHTSIVADKYTPANGDTLGAILASLKCLNILPTLNCNPARWLFVCTLVLPRPPVTPRPLGIVFQNWLL